jgi:hypothetical protein
MQRHRRKHFNPLQAASLARWLVITGFLAVTGLIYVYLQVQLIQLGDRKKALETELGLIRAETEVAKVQYAALSSRTALERRVKEGYLKMIPIAESSIVRLNPNALTPAEDAVQPVVNQRTGR